MNTSKLTRLATNQNDQMKIRMSYGLFRDMLHTRLGGRGFPIATGTHYIEGGGETSHHVPEPWAGTEPNKVWLGQVW